MKVVIIGGVAAGTKVAAKLKREKPQDEIVIYTKGKDISYAGCGLPYYIGGAIETEEELIVNTPAKFVGLTGTQVHTCSEVVAVDAGAKTITVKGDTPETVSYDKLVIAHSLPCRRWREQGFPAFLRYVRRKMLSGPENTQKSMSAEGLW